MVKTLTKKTYYVKGMHCASCEILIEKKLLDIPGIKSAEATKATGNVDIAFTGKIPPVQKINQKFKEDNYFFSEKPILPEQNTPLSDLVKTGAIALIIIVLFVYVNQTGLISIVNVNTTSSLPMFFVFGLLAGMSTCAALIGGLVLSMSKQWHELYKKKNSTVEKMEPHFMFYIGRLLSYAILGAVLGLIGKTLQPSIQFTSFLVMSVSILMIILGLQMLGVKQLQSIKIVAPKYLTRYVTDESNFQGKYMPAIMGALTFFLPCGFTITSQSLALLSGNPWQGAFIMLSFALGTLPVLLLISFASVGFTQKPHLSDKFAHVAGVLVLFFALFTINSQLNVLGVNSLSDFNLFPSNNKTASASDAGLPPVVNGKQLIKMDASSNGYSPNYFKVKAGIPVRWEITDKGTSGCTNAVIAKDLFSGEIPLTNGQVSTKEFTPQKPGRYKFSCWMGMVSGVMEVVDSNGLSSQSISIVQAQEPVSQAQSSCGGNGGCSCGGR